MSEELGLSVKKTENFGKWYLEVLQKAEVLDTRYGIKGFLVYMPLGMLTIKDIYKLFENELEIRKHKPALFPVVIPQSYFKKEAEHIKGFEKEVFWITHAGKNKLQEKMCLRPTSETAMYPMYSIWIRSHLQLPLKLYQSTAMYRYETKMTKPLMRGREFLWIEAHTAQKSWDDAEKQVKEDMEIFKKVVTDNLCIPFLLIKRPEWDKFAGAEETYAFETLLPDGISLQIGTTHNLGEKFANVFNIQYMDENRKKKYVNQTCYGIGIGRILGALISIHGDDNGLIFPPVVAPTQIVIIPIYKKDTKEKVLKKCKEVLGRLKEKGFRVHLDDREKHTPGFKFNEWELKGVPFRIAIGPIDIEKKQVSYSKRDEKNELTTPEDGLEKFVKTKLDEISSNLLKKAKNLMKIQDAENYSDLKEKLKKGGFIRIPFCMKEKCAEKLKDNTGAEVRGTLFEKNEKAKGNCAICGEKAEKIAYVAKAY
ncbi:MAG: proline--tRNA ligase [Candidatus Aenigmarchaeota archaeon]|nr:proline--tRNA ligase [Candidatus Aenigmarchaeota archaeon]